MPLLRWAKGSSLRDGEQLIAGTTHCSAQLSRLLRRPEREHTKAASRREPRQKSSQPSNLTHSRAPPPRPAGPHGAGTGTPVRDSPGGAGAAELPSWPRRPKSLPGEGAEAGRPPLLTRTRLLTAACTADTGAVRSGMAFPSTSPSSCMMTRWEICWATGSRMLSMVRVWKTGMAAAGWGAGPRTQHKLLANSAPAG